jgi:putative cell wall-binding protein
MPTRRPWSALGLAVLLAAIPAASVAAPGAAAPELPPAAYDAEPPPLRQVPAARDRTAAPEPSPRASPGRRQPLAVEGASRYVDDCAGASGDAVDLRRTSLQVGDGTAQLTLRVCTSGPSLDDIVEQTLVWQTTRTTPPTRAHEYRVTRADGEWQVVRDDDDEVLAAEVFLREAAPGVDQLVVQFDEGLLDLPPGCAPSTSVGCINLHVYSFASNQVTSDPPADRLPDDGAPRLDWPSRCRPDIDPAAAGHVRVTTDTADAARAVEDALRGAGYRARAHADAPYVEIALGADPQVQAALLARPDVEAVTPLVPRRSTAVVPDDEQYTRQWYLPHIGMEEAWERRTGSSGAGIAVVDNGVAADRPDFGSRVKAGWDAVLGTDLAKGVHSDLGGHGTAVAGLAAAAGGNGGMAGVDWGADVHPVRVFDQAGCFVFEEDYKQALRWIANRRRGVIDVANFSLGGSPIPGEDDLIRDIVANGTTVVAAVGNQGDRTGLSPSFPAALPEVVAVGASLRSRELAAYSNRGRHVDVVAPGGLETPGASAAEAILTLADPVAVGPEAPFAPIAGTSFSTPLVSGLASLYRAEHPDATPADVTRALLTTAEDLGSGLAGFDIGFGFGIVDAPAVLDHDPGRTMVRLAGGDRYDTAARASRRAFPDPSLVDTVLLATGENYPDALAGGPLAAREHAPLLLTPGAGLHTATVAELARLAPDRVVLLGGTTALSSTVEAELAERGYAVERAAGGDRYATATAIALGTGTSTWRSWSGSDVVYLATGENFPDALPGGAAAAAADAPLLLTARDTLPAATRGALADLLPSRVVLLGGEVAVSQAVVDEIERDLGILVDRAAGGDRYATAVAALCPIPQLCQTDTRFAVVATGEGFADALGGSAAAAALRAPLVLVPRGGPLPGVVADALVDLAPEQAIVLGGSVAVTGGMADQVEPLVVR